MIRFSDMIDRKQVVSHLQKAISQHKVNHAYLIEGAPGSGKKTLALAFAAALQCEKGGTEPCGGCHSCHQAEAGTHPDISYIVHEKPGLISVGEVRDQLVNDISIRPYNGKYKVYIMPDAQLMNPQAQNALLKTLEEPPEYAVILLLVDNAAPLLDTVRSRCVHLHLKPVKEELVTVWLMEHMQIPDYQAKLCAAFARGSIGRAKILASSEEFAAIRNIALTLGQRAQNMDVQQLATLVKETAQYKVSVSEFLDVLSVWYRDVLYFKATRHPDGLIFKDQLQEIRSLSSIISYEGIEQILEAITKAQQRLQANVNFELTMELLFLTIKDYQQ